jgi:RHS repeat-associated protein
MTQTTSCTTALNVCAFAYCYTGKERDSESGLDMFGARYYGSSLGRFMTPDWAAKPVTVPYAHFGNPQSLNLYSYVQNNPTTVGDPDGHDVNQLPTVYVYYPVTGGSANEALGNANNHFTGADGGHYAGLTTPSFSVSWSDSASLTKADGMSTVTRTITSDTVTLTNTVQLPQWKGGSPEEQAAFDKGVAQLKGHEEQHVGDNRAAADTLDKSLPGTKGTGTAPTTPVADTAAKADLKANVGVKNAAAATDMGNRGAARDAATDHGKKPQP